MAGRDIPPPSSYVRIASAGLHIRLWNGGNGTGTVELYEKKGGKAVLIDEVEARNIGCEYGEYGE